MSYSKYSKDFQSYLDKIPLSLHTIRNYDGVLNRFLVKKINPQGSGWVNLRAAVAWYIRFLFDISRPGEETEEMLKLDEYLRSNWRDEWSDDFNDYFTPGIGYFISDFNPDDIPYKRKIASIFNKHCYDDYDDDYDDEECCDECVKPVCECNNIIDDFVEKKPIFEERDVKACCVQIHPEGLKVGTCKLQIRLEVICQSAVEQIVLDIKNIRQSLDDL